MSIAFARNTLSVSRPQSPYWTPITRNRFQILRLSTSPLTSARRFVDVERNSIRWRIRASPSGENIDGKLHGEVSGEPSLDAILSMAEVLFIIPPTFYAIGCVVGMLIPAASKSFPFSLGSKTFVWQFFLLVTSVAIGSLIHRRQWARICRESENGVGVNLLARIGKVEEDLRNSATIVRVLSRQLEKLGIRFGVTRKAMKEPITVAAALAKKTSVATRALALQEDVLAKELGEVPKVLLAMQEQQQKQLELIFVIGKATRLLESKPDTSAKAEKSTLGVDNTFLEKGSKQANNQHADF